MNKWINQSMYESIRCLAIELWHLEDYIVQVLLFIHRFPNPLITGEGCRAYIGRNTPWTGHQPIARNSHPSLKPMGNLESPFSPGVPNHVPWRAKGMQVFIPTNQDTGWFHQLVPSSLVEGVLIREISRCSDWLEWNPAYSRPSMAHDWTPLI